jgi:hypothetical protein
VRLKQRSLHSNLGPVIDLSRSGMRVRTTRRLRGILAVVLFNRNGPHLNVRARTGHPDPRRRIRDFTVGLTA